MQEKTLGFSRAQKKGYLGFRSKYGKFTENLPNCLDFAPPNWVNFWPFTPGSCASAALRRTQKIRKITKKTPFCTPGGSNSTVEARLAANSVLTSNICSPHSWDCAKNLVKAPENLSNAIEQKATFLGKFTVFTPKSKVTPFLDPNTQKRPSLPSPARKESILLSFSDNRSLGTDIRHIFPKKWSFGS